jgi:hypothetical protein
MLLGLIASTVYIVADTAPEVQLKVCKACKAFVKSRLLLVSVALFIVVI